MLTIELWRLDFLTRTCFAFAGRNLRRIDILRQLRQSLNSWVSRVDLAVELDHVAQVVQMLVANVSNLKSQTFKTWKRKRFQSEIANVYDMKTQMFTTWKRKSLWHENANVSNLKSRTFMTWKRQTEITNVNNRKSLGTKMILHPLYPSSKIMNLFQKSWNRL